MSNLKSYLGSIVLAGILLQGCGGGSDSVSDNSTQTAAEQATAQRVASYSATTNAFAKASSEDQAQATSDLKLKFISLYATDTEIKTLIDKIIAGNESITTVAEAAQYMATAMMISSDSSTTTESAPQRNILTDNIITNTVKDTLVGALDTSVGNKVTGAAFDVVLNSEGVTVAMLDLARKSHTTTKIMIDALDADWSLTKKMIPMLQTNKEFGEKFAALAYEEPEMARFFFSRVDAPMYNALADAMLLSNNDAVHDDSVAHSTTQYMALLMAEYATEYFVAHNSGSKPYEINNVKYPQNDANGNLATDDNFVNLLYTTDDVVVYDDVNKTFEGHGDGTELTNEKFFYALFKTPDSTNGFIDAMNKIPADRKALMDLIFLGQGDTNDTVQGYLNIISIGSSMYDGIYGDKESGRTNGYGFGSYAGAFIGFAGLIPSDRYVTYGKAFMNAGYEYAKFHGIDVWAGVSDAAQTAWNAYSEPTTDTNSSATPAPARSAGKGILGSDWYDDIFDVMKEAAYSIDYSDLINAASDLSVDSAISAINANTNRVYGVFMYGLDENNNSVLTDISNPLDVHNDDVAGVHGLIELAVKENQFELHCGSKATDYYTSGYACKDDVNYTMADVNFTLPQFADLTMSFAYNTATEGAMAYYNNNVNADWFADLSSNELIRSYFYPSADNIYIPSWMLAINWLKVANNYNTSEIATTDFDFNAGYFDVYVTSTNPNILIANSEIDLAQVISPVKTITVTKVDMGSDSIIAVDENGTTIDGLNLYKVRTISPEDTQAVLAYLSTLGDSALSAIGLDSSNAANVNTDANTTAAN